MRLRSALAASVAQGAAYVPLAGAVVVLLPLLIAQHAPDDKEQYLAWLSAASSLATAVSLPLIGAWSDRTRSRWGPRAPWIVAGGLVGGLAVVLMPGVTTLLALAGLWIVAQVALNAVDGGAAAVIADDVAPARRGTAVSFLGVATAVGCGIGVLVASRAVGDLTVAAAMLGGLAVAGAALFAPLRGRGFSIPVARYRPGRLLEGFRRIATTPALRRVFGARALLVLGMHGITSYQVYILTDHVGMPLERAAALAGVNAAVYLVAVTVGGLLTGRWSDALGRRAPFLVVAPLLVAVGVSFPLFSTTVPAVIALIVLSGLGMGSFLTVQLAHSIDLLPKTGDAGRDLGVLGVATTATQAVAPLVTLGALSLGVGYAPVFGIAILCALLAAALQLTARASAQP
ncbi:MFS transporter [Oerskovia flava]|uniref:MFS transporter n=1 Tax=Oerskovia flava TaxID=2986422 RepID=UPI00223F2113|nr:MFS transporter [Oerskovia sp. JB1-3-2]